MTSNHACIRLTLTIPIHFLNIMNSTSLCQLLYYIKKQRKVKQRSVE